MPDVVLTPVLFVSMDVVSFICLPGQWYPQPHQGRLAK